MYREAKLPEDSLHSEPDADLEWEERMRYEQGIDDDGDYMWGR